MKRLVFLFLLLFCADAQAQSSTRAQAQAVATCGGQSLTAGVFYPVTQDLTGTLCTQTGGGGSTAVTIADGADVGEGATSAAAATAGGTGSVNAKLRLMTTQLGTLNTTLGSPFQAGGSIGNTSFAVTQGTSPWAVSGVGATGAAATVNAQQTGALTGSSTTGGKLQNVVQCDSHVFKHITTATDTLAVQGVTSQIIYVCAWRSRAAGDATWFLENTASVNANCSSSNTQITGVATETTNSGEVFAPAFWTGLKNTVSNGLCVNSTGTGGVDVDIWYTQF